VCSCRPDSSSAVPPAHSARPLLETRNLLKVSSSLGIPNSHIECVLHRNPTYAILCLEFEIALALCAAAVLLKIPRSALFCLGSCALPNEQRDVSFEIAERFSATNYGHVVAQEKRSSIAVNGCWRAPKHFRDLFSAVTSSTRQRDPLFCPDLLSPDLKVVGWLGMSVELVGWMLLMAGITDNPAHRSKTVVRGGVPDIYPCANNRVCC
jgi:hypothetical protein